ncbi:MAG: hypothetical protein HUJ31_05235 [Pseudomonadales bacterium]|nr:hypothetical protein [Pseudomonadales bacterium]
MSGSIIQAGFVDVDTRDLLAPDATLWEDFDAVSIPLVPTPLDRQPSAYVQESWKDKPRGEISGVSVRAVHTKSAVAIQLVWDQGSPVRSINDYNVFADACAVLFPEDGKQAEIGTMGSEEQPVVGWYWRAGTSDPFEIVARGIGTVERSEEHDVHVSARWNDDRWHVVLARGLDQSRPQLRGADIPIGFAVWCGSVTERAGLKSHSPEFHQLRLVSQGGE